VILDDYGAHKHPKVRAWLGRHPHFVFHYTPTSCFWLNAVEGFFAKLTRRRLKRGVFCSIVDLQAAINRFLRETNDDSKPFVWTAIPIRSSPPSDAGTKRKIQRRRRNHWLAAVICVYTFTHRPVCRTYAEPT
jgi:DDE superfamily endonuclease